MQGLDFHTTRLLLNYIIMLNYITWKSVEITPNYFIHPNTDSLFNDVTTDSTFFETGYKIADGRYVSYVEYPDTTTQATIDNLIATYNQFEFVIIDETTANTLLSELWDVTVANYVFTDNRPVDLF